MFYRINISTKEFIQEDFPADYKDLAGRSLTSKILNDEVAPLSPALGPKNKLILAPGLLGGSAASSSGRLSVGAKSPLTGTIKESNAGGRPGYQLSLMGIKAVIIEECVPENEWYILRISPDGIDMINAQHISNTLIYEATSYLLAEFGNHIGALVIGPAGEFKLSAACIGVTDVDGIPSRHAGRGGLGAVMGSKGIKAIIIDPMDENKTDSFDSILLKNSKKQFSKALIAHPSTGKSLPEYGTNVLINPINSIGGLPTKNFTNGSFNRAELVSGENLKSLIEQNKGKTTHNCMRGCVIRCSNIYKNVEGVETTRGFEYESIALLGPNCEISDLDVLAEINRLCDEIGLDTIEMGVTIGIAMDVGVIEFGDMEGAKKLLDEVRNNTPLGRVIGNGAAVTGKVFGARRIPVVKGQALSAYDPRVLKGTGVTYATSPMGADHTAGNCLPGTTLPDGTIPDPQSDEHQLELSRYIQELAAIFDFLGLCWFSRGPILIDHNLLLNLLVGQLGGGMTTERLFILARKTLQTEIDFNHKAGFTSADDRLPDFFSSEPVEPNNLIFNFTAEELEKVHGGQ